ncbi:MAG: glycerophosphodiester phosphodiesterase family protein [Caulobacteraceae bacterium]
MSLFSSLTVAPFAHRGLWRADGPPENSLAAIQAAVDAGYGAEFDIQLSADGEAVVFHDTGLKRVAGIEGRVEDLTHRELAALRLGGGGDGVPALAQVLNTVRGRQMLLIEIKSPSGDRRLERRAAALLDGYRGPFAVISFDAGSLAWFAEHRARWPRGLDAAGPADADLAQSGGGLEGLFEAQAELARPDFLVLSKDMASGGIARRHRAAGQPVIAWTIRSPAEGEAARPWADNLIFEGFRP